MQYSKSKISIRQVMLLLLTIICSPSVRFLPSYTARYAKQAAWLAPFASLIVLIPMIYILQGYFKKFKQESFNEILESICGKIIGKIIVTLYMLWVTLLNALYVRYYAERVLSTILPNVNITLFIIIMLFSVAVILRSGIAVMARMNEIFLPLIGVIFGATVVFALPQIKLSRLTPISYIDIIPIFKANTSIIGLWWCFVFALILSDVISNKEKTKRTAFQTTAIGIIFYFLVIAMSIGSLGASTIEMIPIPYFAAVKQISVFETIERIESLTVSLWLLSDFVLISVFTFAVMNMTKNMFKLSDTKPFIAVYLIAIYFLSMYLSKNIFELQRLSDAIILPINIAFSTVLPALIFAIGKIRKKV